MIPESRIRRWIRRMRPSRIGPRLLAFNLLIVFLPIAGFLYLDVYERELLAEQERGMVQEARGIAAALGGRPGIGDQAGRIVTAVANQGSRVRIFDSTGVALADTASIPPDKTTQPPESTSDAAIRANLLYRTVAWVVGLVDRLRFDPRLPYGSNRDEAPPAEVRTALMGRYGAATRPTPGQRSLTLNSAWPVRDGSAVTGAVVVSQTTYRTLSALYRIRLRLLKIVALSVAVSIVVSLIVAGTVVRPIDRLRESAAAVSARTTPLTEPFNGTERRDEIGDLARALQDLTRRLDEQIRQAEGFSADVAHEFRNPLASIRAATETIAATDEPGVRQLFLSHIRQAVERLDRMIAGVRDLATLDAQMATESPASADICDVVRAVVSGATLRPGAEVALTMKPSGRLPVSGSPDRLAQVFENVLSNARSFSPSDATVEVGIETSGGQAIVSVADRGPGIPEGHRHRVFERFFTYRPDDPAARRDHAGLGLAIAKAIVDGSGGTITVRDRPGGGTIFEVRLPLTPG